MALIVPHDIIPSPDLEQVRRALELFVPPGGTFEIRGLPSRRSYVGRDVEDAVAFVRGTAGDFGVYWTLNPVRPDATRAASDRDIIRRYWLMIDVDPIRPKDDGSATDLERRDAAEVGAEIQQFLRECGWPDPVLIDTGNGCQLLYRIDLPNNDHARLTVRSILETLDGKFSTDRAKVDTTVHNASRISRLPGTWNRKGANTPTRPHRICQLGFVPDRLEPVPFMAISELLGTAESGEAAPPTIAVERSALTVPAKLPAGSDAAWYRKALENESARVCLGKPGERHELLKLAARTLAGYLHHGAYTEAELRQTLALAGERAGLPAQEVADVLEWGVANGKAKPLARAHKLETTEATTGKVKVAEIKNLVVWAHHVTPKAVEWLWTGRIPLGKMTTFAGQGGLGKTFTLCDIAARVSTGGELPYAGGECTEQGKVLFISGEDDIDDTLVPRLIRCKADLSRIAFLSPESEEHFSLAALELLSAVVDHMQDVRFVVIDPPTSYLANVDDHKNAELRGLLTPLKRWAAEKRVAIVFNNHVNKAVGQNIDAAARVMGSVAWVNAVRAAHMFIRDPDDREKVLFVPIKMNNAPMPKGIIYSIKAGEGGPEFAWIGETDQDAQQALNGERPKSKRVCAVEWLTERFRERRTWASNDLYRDGNEAGIKHDPLFEAKQSLPIAAHKTATQDGRPYWEWTAKEGWPLPE